LQHTATLSIIHNDDDSSVTHSFVKHHSKIAYQHLINIGRLSHTTHHSRKIFNGYVDSDSSSEESWGMGECKDQSPGCSLSMVLFLTLLCYILLNQWYFHQQLRFQLGPTRKAAF
jgi:hypothetical protein